MCCFAIHIFIKAFKMIPRKVLKSAIYFHVHFLYWSYQSSEIGQNKFVLFASLLFTANKTNLFVHFLGESMARQNCFWFYLTFTES